MGQSQSAGEDDSARPRHRNAHLPREFENPSSTAIFKLKASEHQSPASPCAPERISNDPRANWIPHEYHHPWAIRERPSEREKSDSLDHHNAARNRLSMGSTSPPGEMPMAGVVRATNGVMTSEHESRFPRHTAISPPTGPRLGVKPRRLSPERKGAAYRRDWTLPDNSGGPGYRDRDAIEKNWRKHPDNGPRYVTKHAVDTRKPNYPGVRAHACDDSSRSPPLRQGAGNLEKGHIPANRSWDPPRDQISRERSRSPRQKAREVAERLNNLAKAKEGSNQGQKRAEPPERNHENLATGACSDTMRSSDARAALSQGSLLSRGLPSISQHPNSQPGHDPAVRSGSTAAAQAESSKRTHLISSEASVTSGSKPRPILSAPDIRQGGSIGGSGDARSSLPSMPRTTEPNASPGTAATSRWPAKPPVIQPANLSYEGGLHVLPGPLKPQQTAHLQPLVEDARSVVSDMTVATQKSTSSLSSASVTSSETKPRTCHLCKGHISSEYDLGIRCSACRHYFHHRCEHLVTGSEITQEGAVAWKCSRCIKIQRVPLHLNNMHVKSTFDPSYQGSRQSPTPMSPKATVMSADGLPPRKRLKTDTSELAIANLVTKPDASHPQHPFGAISNENYSPAPPTDRPPTLSGHFQDPQSSNVNAAPSASRHETGVVNSGILDARSMLPIPKAASRVNNLISPSHQPALITDKRLGPSSSRLVEPDNSNLISSHKRPYDSAEPKVTLSSTEISSHLQYRNSLSKPVPISAPRVRTQTPTVVPPWQAGPPPDGSSGLGFGIQTLRAGALSPKDSQSGTDQSTSSGIASDAPHDIESANTSIGSPAAPPAGFGAKAKAASKADDELSDTSMSIDSAHSTSPGGKERVNTQENHNQSEQSSPPYSPRLDPFTHPNQESVPATVDVTAPRLNLTNGIPGTQANKASGNIGLSGKIGSSPRKPSSTILQCSKCGKRLLKVSTGEDDVLCGNCTNRETSQSRQSPLLSNVPGKGPVPQGAMAHAPKADPPTPPVNPFNTSTSPSSPASGGTLYLPRTNSYISSSTRRRPELTPAPGLLPPKRRKSAAIARKVESPPNHTYQASQGGTSRPNMKKANELRTPEKTKPQNPHAAKKPSIYKPDPPIINSETDLRTILQETMANNEELQKALESQRSALQNYALKTRTLSDDLKDKEHRNQELLVDAKKLNDQLALKEKRVEELQKTEDENANLQLSLINAENEIKQRIAEKKFLEGKIAQALNEKQQALKEKHRALDEKQQALEKSQLVIMEKQQTYLELQEQQKLLRLERERIDIIQKRQESIERKRDQSPVPDLRKPLPLHDEAIPASEAKPVVPFADLEYGSLNPFEAYPDLEAVNRELPAKTVAKVKPNPSRRFKKLGTRQRLNFTLMDRRFIHRQRPGHPSGRGNKPNGNNQAKRGRRSKVESNRDPLDSSESEDSDTDAPIEKLVGAPAEIMPTIQENGRLCFRDGALGANGKLPRAKIFHKVGKLDLAGQIR